MTRPKTIYRHDIRRRNDRATNSVVLEFVGRGLDFFGEVYGQPEGVFFVASIDEMPFPPEIVALSEEMSVPPEQTESGRQLKAAAVEVLVAEAMVKAPAMLAEFAEPKVAWQDWDRRSLERTHAIQASRLVSLIKLTESEMRLRGWKPKFDPGPLPTLGVMPPPVLVHATIESVRLPPPAPMPALIVRDEPPPPPPSLPPIDVVPIVAPAIPSDATSRRVDAAVRAAREAELPQRLPQGARRHLEKMVRSSYVIRGSEVPQVRETLAEAMRDAESIATSEKVETTVVDWDGEWPVVVRRYGDGGRTVYRVEDALRRAGIEEKVA